MINSWNFSKKKKNDLSYFAEDITRTSCCSNLNKGLPPVKTFENKRQSPTNPGRLKMISTTSGHENYHI